MEEIKQEEGNNVEAKRSPAEVALRDQIAMATISGLLAQGFGFGLEDRLVAQAYRIADAALSIRALNPEELEEYL